MDTNLQHEDLLIQLRGKLNEEKIKLWEEPYLQQNDDVSASLQELARKYATELSVDYDTILSALRELQIHSLDRSKANTQFKETGLATFRVKATLPDRQSTTLRIEMKLDELGKELIAAVGKELNVTEDRVKLIVNGKVLKPTPTLNEQGIKNGAQIMALVMPENPETVQKEDTMYQEMKSTRDDAMLLSEFDDLADDDEYMKLEDQSGNQVELPPSERKALLVGLALHGRGRAAVVQKDYSLALVLLLEADRQFSECRSSILKTVDNWALLQLDIAWCYLCLQSLGAAADASERLARAEEAFTASYGQQQQRLIALKGTAANERVLLMRLYLLQGIVAYHQNKRAEAKALLEKAEVELNSLRVDESSVQALMELGWSHGQARAGLRAAEGQLDAADHYLNTRRQARERAREQYKLDRQRRILGVCADGSDVSMKLVEALMAMGYPKPISIVALRNSNNVVAEAIRLIQENRELLDESVVESTSSEESLCEPDPKLLSDLESMGWNTEEAKLALQLRNNRMAYVLELLMTSNGHVIDKYYHPSTSAGTNRMKHKKRSRKAREEALARLSAAIKGDEDEHLFSALSDEEHYLAQYKSLL